MEIRWPLSILLIAGGLFLCFLHEIPLTHPIDFSFFPAGSRGAGVLLLFLGGAIAIFGKD